MAGKKKTENLPLFLTPEQASKVSGIGVNRVRQLMDEGQLEYLPGEGLDCGLKHPAQILSPGPESVNMSRRRFLLRRNRRLLQNEEWRNDIWLLQSGP